mmetsp:Transcript_10048/g.15307  ORF Transcript_10048/g.15307 Transcript_10048/m.15307 type:complete len:261 (+) Transcript_10048:2546-3328(+)
MKFSHNGLSYELDVETMYREAKPIRIKTHRSFFTKSSNSQIMNPPPQQNTAPKSADENTVGESSHRPNIIINQFNNIDHKTRTPRTPSAFDKNFALGGIGTVNPVTDTSCISSRLQKDQPSIPQHNLGKPLKIPHMGGLMSPVGLGSGLPISKLEFPKGMGSMSVSNMKSNRSAISQASGVGSCNSKTRKSPLVASHEQNANRMRSNMRKSPRNADSSRAVSGRLNSLQMERQNMTDNLPVNFHQANLASMQSKMNLSSN